MIGDYVDELEHELRAATRRRLRLATARVPRAPAGTVASFSAVAVCAVVALALLQTGAPRQAASRSSSAGFAAVAPAGARALVRELAVLRRPQTAAERVRIPPIVEPTYVRPGLQLDEPVALVPSLTRVVATVPGGVRRVVLVVGKEGGRHDYVACVFVWPDNVTGIGLLPPENHLAIIRQHHTAYPLLTLTAADLYTARFPEYWYSDAGVIELVPDGVARVVQKFARLARNRRLSGRPEVLSAAVTNNVSLLKEPRPPGNKPVLLGALEWLSAAGRVVSSTQPPGILP